MKLRRVEIRGFRKLDGPVLLDELGDGLTVIGGQNEEGKSTVLAALKAALFEHHGVGGAVREAMSPHGGGTPEVDLGFELGGVGYRLRKSFRKGGVTLETPRGRLTDDQAEQALQDLLRFERRTARTPQPQNLGLQAVFWLDQGTSLAGFDSLAGNRDRLGSAIEAEVGSIVAGDRGRRLLEAVDKECRRFWTATWRETGPLRSAAERVAELRQCRGELDARRKRYEQAVDRLADQRSARRRAIERDDLGRARAVEALARREVTAVEALEAGRARVASEAEARTADWRRLEEAATRRRQLRERAETMAAEVAAAVAERSRLAADRNAAEAQAATAIAAERRAVEALEETAAAHVRARQRAALAEVEQRRQRLAEDHMAAGHAAEAVLGLRAGIAANPASRERLAAARKAQATRDTAVAALAAVATRLDFVPRPGATVRIDDRLHESGEPLRLTERTELELEPFGRLVVTPGGGDVEARRKASDEATEALAMALAALGARNVAAAEALLDERNRLAGELESQELRLSLRLDAQGVASVEMLAEALATAAAHAAALRRAIGEDGGDDLGDPAAIEMQRATRSASREAASEETRRTAKRAAELGERLAAIEARLNELRRGEEEVARQLAEAAERQPDAALTEALAAAATAKATGEIRLAEMVRQIAAASPELARDRLEQAQRRCRELEAEALRLDRDIGGLEGELRGMGADSFGERLAEVTGELELAEAERGRLVREAGAWRLLHDELAAACSAAGDALLTPILERIRPWLQRLFPTAELVLDAERLEPTHLRRDGLDERFETLSIGTREQLAVLIRLAFARLLLEREGEAPCLILDDALVYADEARFETMKTILQKAAEELQIIVLTCRPRDYLGLDARQIRLEDCRMPSD